VDGRGPLIDDGEDVEGVTVDVREPLSEVLAAAPIGTGKGLITRGPEGAPLRTILVRLPSPGLDFLLLLP